MNAHLKVPFIVITLSRLNGLSDDPDDGDDHRQRHERRDNQSYLIAAGIALSWLLSLFWNTGRAPFCIQFCEVINFLHHENQLIIYRRVINSIRLLGSSGQLQQEKWTSLTIASGHLLESHVSEWI